MTGKKAVDKGVLSDYYSATCFSAWSHRMLNRSLKLLCWVLVIACIGNNLVLADNIVADGGFPGRGDYQSWKTANVSYDLATRQLESLKFDKAIDLYKKAISIYPYDPDYYTNLGLTYKRKGDFPLAEQTYKRAISVKETWDAWANLANVLKKQEKFVEARSAYLSSMRLNPPEEVRVKLERDLHGLKGKVSH